VNRAARENHRPVASSLSDPVDAWTVSVLPSRAATSRPGENTATMNYGEAGTESISYVDTSVMIRDDEMTTETGQLKRNDGIFRDKVDVRPRQISKVQNTRVNFRPFRF